MRKPCFYLLSLLLFGSWLHAATPRESIEAVCRALESYRVDYSGYPSSLDALFPVFMETKPEAFLKHLRYQVFEPHAFQAPEGKMYGRFFLTYDGADGVFGTPDDVAIDTLKVLHQPPGFGFGEVVFKSDLPPLTTD
jgi:hypothetical protein